MTIGERIKLKRLELGISVEELASTLNKNKATVYRYESNDIETLPTDVLEPLATVLQTTPAYLMGWDDESIEDEDIVLLNRGAKKMTPENRKKLIEMAKVVFKEEFE